MKYKVVWIHRVLDRVTELCNSAIESGKTVADITQAMARIDKTLEQNPQQQGESRSGPERILFDPPLSVHFDIDEEERVVVVLAVGYLPRQHE